MKRNGFVFIETIVVISVLSITLLLLFSSYSFMLRKSRQRDTFDNIDLIYKTYYVKDMMDKYKISRNAANVPKTGVYYYFSDSAADEHCRPMAPYSSYVCEYGTSYNGALYNVQSTFEIEKVYYVNPHDVLSTRIDSATKSNPWLSMFDATTIDYINQLGKGNNKNFLIVKYKKKYSDGSYEIFHSSMEV